MANVLDFVKEGPILFVGCHPDDVEIGCGGLIHKLKNKVPIYIITLSKNKKNPRNQNVLNEHFKSLQILGVNQKNIIIGDFITREFSSSRQNICDFLINYNKKIKPTSVFIHCFDEHQDHQICNSESLRAFRGKTIIQYDVPRSTTYPKPTMFVKLGKKDLDAKIKAISSFKTYKNKNYTSKNLISSISYSVASKLDIPISEAYYPVSVIF
jgi:LmbE family N-acetylglucosaminyl deacetylase